MESELKYYKKNDSYCRSRFLIFSGKIIFLNLPLPLYSHLQLHLLLLQRSF